MGAIGGGGGCKWFDITIIGGLEQSGVGCLDKLNIAFLCLLISYIFMWTVMLLIHLPTNSGSVECTS